MSMTMELTKVIYAEEYHEHIPLLFTNPGSGVVHSIFQNGFNIKIENNLYFIGTTKNGSLPFGIHLSYSALMKLMGNLTLQEPVCWDRTHQQIRFTMMNYSIDIQHASTTQLSLNESMIDDAVICKNLPAFVSVLLESNAITGLDISAGDFVCHYIDRICGQSKTEQYLQRLSEVVFSRNKQEIEGVLRFLIGRGKGLTPSGDDHLVGLLAIAHASGQYSSAFMNVLQHLIVHESLTTDVGREYLRYAVNGQFSSAVMDVADELCNENQTKLKQQVEKLMEMGHSSGVDTLFGMLIGLLAIRRK